MSEGLGNKMPELGATFSAVLGLRFIGLLLRCFLDIEIPSCGSVSHMDVPEDSLSCLSWPKRNKLSSQWLLTPPGHNTSLTSEKFTQCVEALLPSTACSSRIGEKVGNTRVDVHGD